MGIPLAVWIGLLSLAIALPPTTTHILIPLSTILYFSPLILSVFVVLIPPFTLLSAYLIDTSSKRAPKKNERLQEATKSLKISTKSAWSAILLKASWESSSSTSTAATTQTAIHPSLPPSLTIPLNTIISLISSSFVSSWYLTRISPSPVFPLTVDSTVRHVLGELITRSEKVDLAKVMVGKIVPHLTGHLESFSNAEKRCSSMEMSTMSAESRDLFLSQAYGPTTLHSSVSGKSLDTKASREAHLRSLVEKVLPKLLPAKESTKLAGVIGREILAMVLGIVTEMLGEPDFWNGVVDKQVGDYMREQDLIAQLRTALDATSQTPGLSAEPLSSSTPVKSPSSKTKSQKHRASISTHTSQKSFESFVRSIGKITSLLEARRLRSDVIREIRKTKGELEVLRGGPGGEALRGHLERLFVARERAEARIRVLSGGAEGEGVSTLGGAGVKWDISVSPTKVGKDGGKKIGLYEILTSPTGVSYFMEFMERKKSAVLVQFWLMVESFKTPLEEEDEENEDESDEKKNTWREDMKMLLEAYFEDPLISQRFGVDLRKEKEDIRRFVEQGDGLGKAKRSMFSTQRQIYDEMNEEFIPAFQKSGLYLKAVSESSSTTVGGGSSGLKSPHTTISKPTPKMVHRSTAPPVASAMAVAKSDDLFGSPSASSPFSQPSHSTPSPPHLPSRSESAFRTVLQPSTIGPQLSIASPAFDFKLSRGSRVTTLPRRRTSSWTSETDFSALQSSHRSNSTVTGNHATEKGNLDFLLGGSDPDISSSRAPLFGDEEEDDIGAEEEEDDDFVEVQKMEAIQAALTNIIAHDQSNKDRQKATPPTPVSAPSFSRPSAIKTGSAQRAPSATPSVDSLLTPDIKRKKSFQESDGENYSTSVSYPAPLPTAPFRTATGAPVPAPMIFTKPEKRVFDDVEDVPFEEDHDTDNEAPNPLIQFATPGDLHLPLEIRKISEEIYKREHQLVILDALIRKAELTGNQHELHLLSKSRNGLRRETRALNFQRTQYAQQEHENRLDPSKTRTFISSTTTNLEDGKQVVRYIIEIKQMAADGKNSIVGWVIARRFNEFFLLHSALKEKYPHAVKGLELPAKKLVTSMSTAFIDARRVGLEKYLQALVASAELCASMELRSFLSQQTIATQASSSSTDILGSFLPPLLGQNLVTSIFQSVQTSIDESLALGPSMLDLIGQRLQRQAAGFASMAGINVALPVTTGNESNLKPSAALNGTGSSAVIESAMDASAPDELRSLEGETATGYFTAPICDLFVEIFELKEKNWLRRQAIVIILQQLLGDTIERRLRTSLNKVVGEESLLKIVNSFSNSTFPGGKFRERSVPRTDEQKTRTKVDAGKKLSTMMPDIAASMIGRSNARRGARRIFAVFQSNRLNLHLMHTIIDEIFMALFPDIDFATYTGTKG